MSHAKLSPSGAERWMNCPGSVVLEEGCADSTSAYADEGTAAHALAAMCLTEGKPAAAFIGRRLTVINGVYWPGPSEKPAPLLKGQPEIVNHFEVDDDMAEAVQVYLDNIKLYVAGANDLLVEQRLPIGHITGEEDAEGTGDALIMADGGEELQLHDLKFGRGYAVSAAENKQLMLYALGALMLASLLGYAPTRVRLVIHQPRINNAPDEWCCSVAQIQAFAKEVEEASSRVDAAVVYFATYKDLHDKYVAPGDAQCKWCKAKATCKALADKVQQVIEADFTVIAAESSAEHVEANVPKFTSVQLGEKLDAVDLIEMWASAVRAETERRLLRGEPVPSPKGGYKLVQGKRGRRSWADATAVEARMKSMRLKKEEMYDFKLISPTTAEKLLKPTPKRWSALEEHITQSAGKAHVAPMSDKRPVLVVQTPDEMFAPVPTATAEDLA